MYEADSCNPCLFTIYAMPVPLQRLLSGTPGSTPIEVRIPTDPKQPAAGSRAVKVWPVLIAVEGDIPFMEKVTNSIGHSAKHACFRCALTGEWHPEARTVRSAPAFGCAFTCASMLADGA